MPFVGLAKNRRVSGGRGVCLWDNFGTAGTQKGAMGRPLVCGLYLQKHTLACGRLQVSAGFLDSQCEGREFDPPPLHHKIKDLRRSIPESKGNMP